MYARSTSIRGNPEAMDRCIAYARDEVMPALQGMSGCVGLSMLADRESGRCIITSAWADETAMHATEQSAHELRDRAGEIMGGPWEAQVWEIALLHRRHEGHDGCATRVMWAEEEPARVDDALSALRAVVLPRLEELPGFCSVSILADRASGHSAMAFTYDSREDMLRGGEQMAALREQLLDEHGMRMTDLAEFELVLHHLRVPETV